jgi:hypothetical protein
MPHAGELIGLTHDLGKYSDAFQKYLQKVANDAAMEMEPDPSLKGSVDHSTAGTQIIAEGFAGKHKGLAAQMLVLCVSTQLIEAGVDIEFATVLRDLARRRAGAVAMATGLAGGYILSRLQNPHRNQLEEIRYAQQNARRMLEDWRDERGDAPFPLSDRLEMERFFRHHFFARKELDGLSREGSP